MSDMTITVPVLRDAASYALEAIEKSMKANGETVFVVVIDDSVRYVLCENLWFRSHSKEVLAPGKKQYQGRIEGRDWTVVVLAEGL